VQAIGVAPFISAGPGRLPLRVRQVKIRRCKSRATLLQRFHARGRAFRTRSSVCLSLSLSLSLSLARSLALRSDSCWRCRVKPRSRNRTGPVRPKRYNGNTSPFGDAFCLLHIKQVRARARPRVRQGRGKEAQWGGRWVERQAGALLEHSGI